MNTTRFDIAKESARMSGLKLVDAEKSLRAFFEEIEFQLWQGNSVHFREYFKLIPKERRATNGRNMRTGMTLDVPERIGIVARFGPKIDTKRMAASGVFRVEFGGTR